jgi:hypothetical protein
MTWGVSRTLHAMSDVEMVTIRAVVACLGLERGQGPVRIAKTPLVVGALANGYLVEVPAEAEPVEPPADPAPVDPAPVDPPAEKAPADPPQAPALTGSGERRKRTAPRG